MRAVTNTGLGRGNGFFVDEYAVPDIGPHDVLVEVHASSVNPKDWKLNTNFNRLIPRVAGPLRPLILGDDLAGIVRKAGRKVTGIEVGERVYGMDMNIRTGAIAEYACIAARRIARMPENLTFEEAAAVPLAGLTALQCLQIARVAAGSRVLVIGASGGVGTFAVQIARALGAEVTGVCSERNAKLVRELGAAQVIDYHRERYLEREDSFDAVIDAVSFYSLGECASLLRDGGYYVSTMGYGASLVKLARDQLRPDGKHARFVKVDANTRDLDTLREFIGRGAVRVVIDSVYDMDDVAAAYAKSRAGHSVGKLVIRIREARA